MPSEPWERRLLDSGLRTADIALPGEAVVVTAGMGDAVVAANKAS